MNPIELLQRARKPLTIQQLAHATGAAPIAVFQSLCTDGRVSIVRTRGGGIDQARVNMMRMKP